MSSTPLNISFRRALVGEKLNEWLRPVAQVSNFNSTKSGQFTVLSMPPLCILQLMHKKSPFCHELILKLKIPLKINIFCWYLRKGVILTKDNLLRKKWKGSQKCSYSIAMKQSNTYLLNANMQR
jgi:hypothetical protein